MAKVKALTKKDEKLLARLRHEKQLPHLYGQKFYPWSKAFFESTNRFVFLCAGNQLGKSSIQIRKAIHWATAKELWPKLWPGSPNVHQFLYMYPSKPVATTEYFEKWVPDFLPKDKKDLVYGWKEEFKNKEIWAIHFNSGVSIYFKTYAQDTQDLQTSTIHAIFCDEEIPESHYHETRTRLTATQGYFSLVFTATLGQELWRKTIEPQNPEEELHKDALKLQVSLWDCLKYADGTKSPWTPERIKEIEMNCATEAEAQKRVHGKFVISGGGLVYESFSRTNNMCARRTIPHDWLIYTGVDIGSGGGNHPAAISMVAVRPDFKYGIVFKGWRGDGVVTTAADVLDKHTELLTYHIPNSQGTLTKVQYYPTLQLYDWHNKDFHTIASRAGQAFTPADKSRERGTTLLNTLFKLKMLDIMDGDPELSKLVLELSSLQGITPKTRALDDFCDSLRYSLSSIPWDFDGVAGEIIKQENGGFVDERSKAQKHFDDRRPGSLPSEEEGQAQESIEDIFDEWNHYLGN